MKYICIAFLLSSCTITLHCKCDCGNKFKAGGYITMPDMRSPLLTKPQNVLHDTVWVMDGKKKVSYLIH